MTTGTNQKLHKIKWWHHSIFVLANGCGVRRIKQEQSCCYWKIINLRVARALCLVSGHNTPPSYIFDHVFPILWNNWVNRFRVRICYSKKDEVKTTPCIICSKLVGASSDLPMNTTERWWRGRGGRFLHHPSRHYMSRRRSWWNYQTQSHSILTVSSYCGREINLTNFTLWIPKLEGRLWLQCII